MRTPLIILLLLSGCAALPVKSRPAETDSLVLHYSGMYLISRPLDGQTRRLCAMDSVGRDTLATVPYIKGSLRLELAAGGWAVFALSGAGRAPYEVYVSRFDSVTDFEVLQR